MRTLAALSTLPERRLHADSTYLASAHAGRVHPSWKLIATGRGVDASHESGQPSPEVGQLAWTSYVRLAPRTLVLLPK